MFQIKNFALIGAAGYVAPRHLQAINDTGNHLIAALDVHDNVGVLDSYFPKADFFVEFERFDRHIDKLKRMGKKIDYLSICSPNYLHDAHIRFGLRIHADVICEKPLVINPWNLDALAEIEKEYDKKIYSILQLRFHQDIIDLKNRIDKSSEIFEIDLTYITARGNWYFTSWKGDEQKSGGIATNIGIHFFDMLQWIFGSVQQSTVHLHTHDRASGLLIMPKAKVRWFMSINEDLIPDILKSIDQYTYRSIKIKDEELEFSNGFIDLHTLSYEAILSGQGFGLDDCRPSIEMVHQIRNSKPIGLKGDFHPLAKYPLSKHPFRND